MTNRASNMERAFRQPPDEGDFELTRGDTFAVFLFAPLYGYYVLLADLNMPLSVICHLSFVICHLSSVIRFAYGYRLLAIREAPLLRTTSRSQHASICHLSFVICHSLRSRLSANGYSLFAQRFYWAFAQRLEPSDDAPQSLNP